MSNALATTNGRSWTLATEPAEVAKKLKLMIVNGKRYTDDEAMALAAYGLVNNLNPFVGECYYLQGIGPGPGIAGWRKKADEQLEYEARKAAEPLARFWVEYTDPDKSEVGALNTGDIAVKVILHDTLTKNAWEKRTLSNYIEMVKNGIKENAWEIAKELSGNEPTWSAVGIVRAGENFGADKMPRYERACKRGEKATLRKRFPRIHLPEPENFDANDVVESTFVEQPEKPRRSEAEIIGDLGYDAPPEPKLTEAATVEQLAPPFENTNQLAEHLVARGLVPDEKAAQKAIDLLKIIEVNDHTIKMVVGYQGWLDMGDKPADAAASILKGEYPK